MSTTTKTKSFSWAVKEHTSWFLFGIVIILAVINFRNYQDLKEVTHTLVQTRMSISQVQQQNLRLTAQVAQQQKEVVAPPVKRPMAQLTQSTIQPWQSSLCLALVIYGEERMGSPTDMMKIGDLVINQSNLPWYGNNPCLVATAHNAFASVKPYRSAINQIVWGKIRTYEPYSARTNKFNHAAWVKIKALADNMVAGRTPLLTDATNMLSMFNLTTVPTWAKRMRPAGHTSGHILLIDHEKDAKGHLVRYTVKHPYKQSEYVKLVEASHKEKTNV